MLQRIWPSNYSKDIFKKRIVSSLVECILFLYTAVLGIFVYCCPSYFLTGKFSIEFQGALPGLFKYFWVKEVEILVKILVGAQIGIAIMEFNFHGIRS